ncbi:RDD family protein [Streptomyces sp. RS10V-4]|uniref:RDD family protein n=1 Tax=Streptomyces rhizoryzae TaxID=2932493 RepID=UPI002002E41E|nr:RDD family protein [Streptomyces rhizoryzae]MCK7625627.1 RDD family protein [Streptomyces rhizoryzae]
MPGQEFPPQPYPPYNQQPPYPSQQQPYPYQQPPPPQGQPGYQSPYQQPPAPYPYQPTPPQAPAPHVPEAVSAFHRFGASAIDTVLAAAVGYLGFRFTGNPRQGVITALIAAFGFSFVNHVLLTRVARASIGKLLTRTRVALSRDGGCPRLPRLFRRWLAGYLFLAYAYITDWFRRIGRPDRSDLRMPDQPKDFCGIRLVRSDALPPTS